MSARLAWVERSAAEYACRHWHYSHRMPAGRLMVLGVFEANTFVGVVIFGRGSTPKIGQPYGLSQGEVCELVRVAMREHRTPVSRILAVSLRMLKKRCPGMRLVVSYAAAEEGHHGGIYQANGWVYEGPMESYCFEIGGQRTHARTVSSRYKNGIASEQWLRQHVDPFARKVKGLTRHKYLMPLDPEIAQIIAIRAKPYPKQQTIQRAKQATFGNHPDGGGAAPTRALQTNQDTT
jgi:hypothetical protein